MARMASLTRVRWTILLQLALTTHRHWRRLQPKDRARLAELIRKSQGVPNKLTAKERNEVRELLHKLEPKEFARSLALTGRRAMRGRTRP
jgi:hypothetical protein